MLLFYVIHFLRRASYSRKVQLMINLLFCHQPFFFRAFFLFFFLCSQFILISQIACQIEKHSTKQIKASLPLCDNCFGTNVTLWPRQDIKSLTFYFFQCKVCCFHHNGSLDKYLVALFNSCLFSWFLINFPAYFSRLVSSPGLYDLHSVLSAQELQLHIVTANQ